MLFILKLLGTIVKSNFFKVSVPVILLIISLFYITSKFIEPPVKRELTIAAGSKNGTYYKMAMQYKELLKEQKVELRVLETKGSLENIQLLKEKKADLAFMQNGIDELKELKNISSLGNIYYEPLWVFYKAESFDVSYLIELMSKNISVGLNHSGTSNLALKLLGANGIDDTNSNIVYMNSQDSKQSLLKGDIDAMFVVSSQHSKIIKELLENPSINVLNIKRAKAYSRKYAFIEALDLYEGSLDLFSNIPNSNIKLLATTATLVANNEVPHELIRIFLKQVKNQHTQKGLFQQENQFPNLLNLNININEEAKQYLSYGDNFLEKIFPYWIASNIDRLKILLIPLITLGIPLLKGFFPLYIWSMRSKIYKWYKELKKYDSNLEENSIEELEKKLKLLNALKNEIQEETTVTSSFMGEYYNLILHIDLIDRKIRKLIKNKKLI